MFALSGGGTCEYADDDDVLDFVLNEEFLLNVSNSSGTSQYPVVGRLMNGIRPWTLVERSSNEFSPSYASSVRLGCNLASGSFLTGRLKIYRTELLTI